MRRTLVPLYRDKFENEQHAYAKARLVDLLKRRGYDYIETEREVPCTYVLAPNYQYQFSLDVYAEMHENGDPEGPLLDVIAFEIGGLSTYHSSDGRKTNSGRPFREVREQLKRELVCQQYPEIKPERYFFGKEKVDKDAIFSKKYMRTDEQLIEDYGLLLLLMT